MYFKYAMQYINCFLAASILAIHGIRYILNAPGSNTLMYIFYVLFFIISIILYKNRSLKEINILTLIISILAGYILITSIGADMRSAVSGLKLICIFILSLCFYLMDINEYRITIKIMYGIVAFYIVLLFLNPQRIPIFMIDGINYLTMTLPIGFVFSMLLAKIVVKVYMHGASKDLVFDSLGAVICFLALLKFPARGSIIFPFIVMIVFAVVWGGKYFFKSWFVFIGVAIILQLGFEYFLENASQFGVNRMLHLFENSEGESRWWYWNNYISIIINDWQLLGGGTGCSAREAGYYPHNLYLHFIGEFGLIGFIFSIYLTILVCIGQFRVLIQMSEYNEDNILFVEFSAGLLFLFLCFMKSFSIYDGASIMMMTMAVISMSKKYSRSLKFIDYHEENRHIQ